ncbi:MULTISPECIES: barstar family protein [Streptomyces]|uniref:barstar family protein n=1 Tax=Streptomyces TaxID=1883 RepID=UPI000997CDBE|nr:MULTISPECIES: barstar family protein [Streptomyces]
MENTGPFSRNLAQIKPWLHLAGPDTHAPIRDLLPVPGSTFSAWMSGTDMGDLDGVFQSFWDGFRLPDYFGWNFPALNDCLRDLNWISADQYFLFIDEAHKVLAENPEELYEFLSILSNTGARWSFTKRPEASERGRFQVVLACSQESLPRIQKVAASLG